MAVKTFAPDTEIGSHLICDASELGITDALLVHLDIGNLFTLGDEQSGMRLILERAPEGRPILAFFEPDNWSGLAEDMLFHACIGCKNVRMLPYTGNHVVMGQAYKSILANEGVEDTLARELIGLVDPVTTGLLKDLERSVLHDDRRLALLAKARSLGYEGLDKNIIEAISNSRLSREMNWNGHVLEGVFCDIVGTLWDHEKNLNEKVFMYLAEQAETRPITLWTGGKLEATEYVLRALPVPTGGRGVPWKLVGKPCFRGATVEEVVDDDLLDLGKSYGISYEKSVEPKNIH